MVLMILMIIMINYLYFVSLCVCVFFFVNLQARTKLHIKIILNYIHKKTGNLLECKNLNLKDLLS